MPSPPRVLPTRANNYEKNAGRPRGVCAATLLTDRIEGKGPAWLLFSFAYISKMRYRRLWPGG